MASQVNPANIIIPETTYRQMFLTIRDNITIKHPSPVTHSTSPIYPLFQCTNTSFELLQEQPYPSHPQHESPINFNQEFSRKLLKYQKQMQSHPESTQQITKNHQKLIVSENAPLFQKCKSFLKSTNSLRKSRRKPKQNSFHLNDTFSTVSLSAPDLPNLVSPVPIHVHSNISHLFNGFTYTTLLNKGLKHLSVIVSGIVSHSSSITYKHVSDCILNHSYPTDIIPLQTPDHFKNQQNIKRRVYDALNVMIAAGVLTKTGKCVSLNKGSNPLKLNTKRTHLNLILTGIVF